MRCPSARGMSPIIEKSLLLLYLGFKQLLLHHLPVAARQAVFPRLARTAPITKIPESRHSAGQSYQYAAGVSLPRDFPFYMVTSAAMQTSTLKELGTPQLD